MKTQFRTHHCGALSAQHVGETVAIAGWVHRIRDHGDLLFVDLRDQYGVTQCVVEPNTPSFSDVEALSPESTVVVHGNVAERPDDTNNEALATGEIEVRIQSIEVLNQAHELPLPVFGEPDYPEDIRLRNRFLDLRRASLRDNIILRNQVIRFLRERMYAEGFMEFQTPLLTASSPEGARDFLVPSRLHPGKFYALPQAPQQFKQMIVTSGFDRYFQIAPCFRDEDARADRSPGEFYQLDVEMAFAGQEDVLQMIEPVLRDTFKAFARGRSVTDVFPRIAYKDSMRRFASDKPDLRNPLEFSEVSDLFRDGGFGLFAKILQTEGNEIWALPAPKGGSRAFCDRMNQWAQQQEQPGLGYIFWRDGEGAGPIARNLGEERTAAIREKLNLQDGDAAFFIAGAPDTFAPFAAQARNHVGQSLDLVETNCFRFCWIVDYPMFEHDPDTGGTRFTHNPFSMPQGGRDAVDSKDPLDLLAYQYDIVCNGVELSSGAVRNHDPELMVQLFEIAGYSRDDVETAFGGLFRAFHYGAPPHGGIAPGVDRIVMLLADAENLREVILFPVNQQGQDLLMNAPADVSDDQLKVLGLRRGLKVSE